MRNGLSVSEGHFLGQDCSKGLSINNLTISHPIFEPSLNAPQSRKPQHSPGYVSPFPQSFRPNLAQILARDCEGYLLTGPKRKDKGFSLCPSCFYFSLLTSYFSLFTFH